MFAWNGAPTARPLGAVWQNRRIDRARPAARMPIPPADTDSEFAVAKAAWERGETSRSEAMLAPDPNAKGGRIQLLAPINENSAVGKFLANKGPGVHHVAYTVTDVEAAADALRAKGLRLLNEAPRRGTHGSRINFVHPKDARGVLVELVEPSAEH